MAGRAVVVGGGIGGLAAGIGLHGAGWEVTVLERSAGLPATGTGLGIWPTAMRALDTLGVGDEVRRRARRQAGGSIRRPDGRRDDVAELRLLFGDWHSPVRRVLDALTPAGVLRHEIRDLTPLPSYVAGRVALLGDAAHAMTPDLGQGACQALIDAVALADCVRDADDLPAALRAYDRRRRRPTQRIAAGARWAGRLAQAGRLLPVRDAVLRLALAAGPPA